MSMSNDHNPRYLQAAVSIAHRVRRHHPSMTHHPRNATERLHLWGRLTKSVQQAQWNQ